MLGNPYPDVLGLNVGVQTGGGEIYLESRAARFVYGSKAADNLWAYQPDAPGMAPHPAFILPEVFRDETL